MTSAQMVMQGNPKDMARRLVGICGGPAEAISTLMEGATQLFGKPRGAVAERLAAITEEIAALKTVRNDAYSLIHHGRTRKGGMPNVKRFL